MRFVSLAAVLAAVPALAQAADYLPPPPIGRLPGPVEEFTWGGLYGGIHVGEDTADFRSTKLAETLARDAYYQHIAQDLAVSFARLNDNPSDQQPHIGGFIGYNAMFDDAMVGLELDYTHMKSTLTGQSAFSDGRRRDRGAFSDSVSYSASARSELGDYAILKARGGYAIGRFLPYASIGLVVGKQRLAAAYNSTYTEYTLDTTTGAITGINTGPTPHNSSVNKVGYNYGGAVGVGLDVALLDNVFVRAEYQYIGMANFRGLTTSVNTFRVGAGVKY